MFIREYSIITEFVITECTFITEFIITEFSFFVKITLNYSLQTIVGKSFWSLTILFMVTLGMYWCTELYLNWDDQPVLTTITTAGLPVESVMNIVSYEK
jgi:hypothetical protein